MDNPIMVPNGDYSVKVELTVKEIMALSGIRFNEQPDLAPHARKKLLHTLDELFTHSEHPAH